MQLLPLIQRKLGSVSVGMPTRPVVLRASLRAIMSVLLCLARLQEAAKSEISHRQEALQEVQSELAQLRAAHAALGAEKQQREGELVGRLEAMQRECAALLAVVEQAEEQHAEVRGRHRLHWVGC